MHTRRTEIFVGAVALSAACSIAYAAFHSQGLHPAYVVAVLGLSATTSRMKVKLPGLDGNMSVNLPFLLLAVASLSAIEAALIAGISTIVQCWPKSDGKFKPQQMLFNVSMMMLAVSMANIVYNVPMNPALDLVLATTALFLCQTVPVASIIKLSGGSDKSVARIWQNIAQLSFPYFVIGAGVTSLMIAVSHNLGWQTALAGFPVMYAIHLSYKRYFTQLAEALTSPVSLRPLAMARAAGASL
jgi:hypothetical protein